MPDGIRIVRIEDLEEKAKIASEVLLDLPDWFGIPEARDRYVEDSKGLPFWAARAGDEVIGFVTLTETNPEAGEVHCMGVKKAHHRKGIGTQLYLELEKYARQRYKYLQVKTVEEGHYPEYDRTVAFYKSVGFSKLEVFPTLWDRHNPCLIMVKAL
ncbi:MAG: GNAT family N-acetyltransferase [Firmicutes bacterium]|nr:GNAT family N-acetyltransferase [Candidatus Fermentithermobacillaceae bacterium]